MFNRRPDDALLVDLLVRDDDKRYVQKTMIMTMMTMMMTMTK